MAKFLFANNAVSVLAADIDNLTGTITVSSGDGALFPSPGANEQFAVTVRDTTSNSREIMYCTARTGDTLTVTRAQESTAAQSFTQGAEVSAQLTAGGLNYIRDL